MINNISKENKNKIIKVCAVILAVIVTITAVAVTGFMVGNNKKDKKSDANITTEFAAVKENEGVMETAEYISDESEENTGLESSSQIAAAQDSSENDDVTDNTSSDDAGSSGSISGSSSSSNSGSSSGGSSGSSGSGESSNSKPAEVTTEAPTEKPAQKPTELKSEADFVLNGQIRQTKEVLRLNADENQGGACPYTLMEWTTRPYYTEYGGWLVRGFYCTSEQQQKFIGTPLRKYITEHGLDYVNECDKTWKHWRVPVGTYDGVKIYFAYTAIT